MTGPNQVVSEFEAAKAGKVTVEPLCMITHLALAGEDNERINELAAARMLILQAECHEVNRGNGDNGLATS